MLGLYCVPASCPYAGRCGNGLLNEERLALARDRRSKSYGPIAAADIDKVASRAIKSGEEVTVSYGDDLWFLTEESVVTGLEAFGSSGPYSSPSRSTVTNVGSAGADLGSYHELGARGGGEDDPRTPVASFTKTKRLRSDAAVTGLRKQLVELDAEAARALTDIMQMMVLMREESEARRVEELQRRRDESFEKEARR
ncbi:hypothetical protein PybrP1_002732, partial [[Pythium] brassicae (nom. inval.)]